MGSPAGLAGQSGGSGIVAHWTVPSGQRTTTAAVAPPSSDAAHRAFGGHALSTAIATGSSERGGGDGIEPDLEKIVAVGSSNAHTGPRRGRRRPPRKPVARCTSRTRRRRATPRPAAQSPDQAEQRGMMRIRGGEHADRPRGVADVQPGAAVHRRHPAPPRSAISPAAAMSHADRPPCWMKASKRPFATYDSERGRAHRAGDADRLAYVPVARPRRPATQRHRHHEVGQLLFVRRLDREASVPSVDMSMAGPSAVAANVSARVGSWTTPTVGRPSTTSPIDTQKNGSRSRSSPSRRAGR